MKKNPTRIPVIATLAILAACTWVLVAAIAPGYASSLDFGPEHPLGRSDKNPAAPFLRFGPDGRSTPFGRRTMTGRPRNPTQLTNTNQP